MHDTILLPSSVANVKIDYVRWIPSSFADALCEYQDAFLYPSSASILAHAVRVAPILNVDGLESIFSDAVDKEISAAISIYDESRFDYRVFLNSDSKYRDFAFCSRFRPNPEVASSLFTRFIDSRPRLNNMLVFPDLGRKTVGRITTQQFWNTYRAAGCTFMHDGSYPYGMDVTPTACMRLSVELGGGTVSGPVEMRTSWMYNQIGPRVYYARGGSILSTSMFIQPIINRLIDMFPEVHRINRFAPLPISLTEDDLLVIYDYTAFTSSLFEIRRFVEALSSFYRGVVVRCLHPVYGIQHIDLGQLFSDYNRDCNMFADFDISRVSTSTPPDSILQHPNGMLGVPGNIFLATLLHGIFTRFLSGGVGRSRCVGDDAVMAYSSECFDADDELVLLSYRVSAMAPIHPDKFKILTWHRSGDLSAHRYVKRPIRREFDDVVQGFVLALPSIASLFSFSDDWHTVLPPRHHPCRTAFRSLCRLFSDMKSMSFVLEDDPTSNLLVKYVWFILNEIRRMDPDGEHAPINRADRSRRYSVPDPDMWGKVSYEEFVMMDLGYDEMVRFPKNGGARDDFLKVRAGECMHIENGRLLGLLEKLGYVRKEPLFDDVSLQLVGSDLMEEYLSQDYRYVSLFWVEKDIPSFYTQVAV
jgi:hypothetical protein